jgi:hypothetical protein
VWKLAKVQLCNNNVTPPYHENIPQLLDSTGMPTAEEL